MKWVNVNDNFSDALLTTTDEYGAMCFLTHLLNQKSKALNEQKLYIIQAVSQQEKEPAFTSSFYHAD
ncbi:hypothetical protein [Lysinibacillus sp. NPDC093216]|uniref:hypothetical protein n=1 Tax=Lysinibacillus sp. NPDC093216 TaxID=3390576 RepID=UPI003D0318C9